MEYGLKMRNGRGMYDNFDRDLFPVLVYVSLISRIKMYVTIVN